MFFSLYTVSVFSSGCSFVMFYAVLDYFGSSLVGESIWAYELSRGKNLGDEEGIILSRLL